jgi:hypothetical protein
VCVENAPCGRAWGIAGGCKDKTGRPWETGLEFGHYNLMSVPLGRGFGDDGLGGAIGGLENGFEEAQLEEEEQFCINEVCPSRIIPHPHLRGSKRRISSRRSGLPGPKRLMSPSPIWEGSPPPLAFLLSQRTLPYRSCGTHGCPAVRAAFPRRLRQGGNPVSTVEIRRSGRCSQVGA